MHSAFLCRVVMRPAGGTRDNHFSSSRSSSVSLAVLVLVLILLQTASSVPSRCDAPPPPLSCGSEWRGDAYYYNASSTAQRCLCWPDRGCPESTLFPTLEDCMRVCGEPGENEENTSMSV